MICLSILYCGCYKRTRWIQPVRPAMERKNEFMEPRPMSNTTLLSLFDRQLMIQLGLSTLSIVAYVIAMSGVHSTVLKFGGKHNYAEKRVIYTKKFFGITFFLILLIAMTFIWGIDFRGILIFASSFFAVVGIALFASWSILSNITSGVILFFSFPFKLGDTVRIVDGDNSIEGKIIDITLFSLHIKDRHSNIVSYPNNLAIQKPIAKLHD